MGKEKRKIWNLPPEEEQKGLLFWFQLLQKHYYTLLQVNIYGVGSLLPCAYFLYLLVQTKDLVFWLLALVCFALAGPCQAGMNSVCVRLVHKMPVWVKEDFARAWKDWKKSVPLSLLLGLAWSMLAYGVYMVISVDGGLSVSYFMLFLVVGYLLTGISLFAYQQVAMLELSLSAVLKNAVLLVFAGKLRSFFAIVVLVAMALIPVIYYGLAVYLLLLGWCALGVLTANLIFAPTFAKLFLSGEAE